MALEIGAPADSDVEPGDYIQGYLVCEPDYQMYPGTKSFETGYWQIGKCSYCGEETISQAKWSICSCGHQVYGT